MAKVERFEDLLEEAKADKNIIGLFLTGSRGKGFETENSDYDVDMVVKDKVAEEYKKKYEMHTSNIDLGVSSLSEFTKYAAWQSDYHWDRYNFTHVQALIDTNGQIQKLIDEKGSIPADKKEDFIRFNLEKLSISTEEFLSYITNIMSTGDLNKQQELEKIIEKLFREEGYGKVFDDWGEKLPWAVNYNS